MRYHSYPDEQILWQVIWCSFSVTGKSLALYEQYSNNELINVSFYMHQFSVADILYIHSTTV